MKSKTVKYLSIAVVFLALAMIGFVFKDAILGTSSQPLTVATSTAQTVGTTGGLTDAGCNSIPTVAYSGADALSSSYTMTGTQWYKSDGLNPSTTALTNPPAGTKVTYWIQNASQFVKPIEATIICSANNPVTAKGFHNSSSLDISLRDVIADVTLTDTDNIFLANATANNVSIGANTVKNLQLYYTGTKWLSSAPYGACLVVDVPSNISSVSVSGYGITAGCPYQNTYPTADLDNTPRSFFIPAGFDDGTATTKTINIQLASGANNPNGASRLRLYPANYYLTNNGEFALDIEEALNGATTNTFTGGYVFDYNFAIN